MAAILRVPGREHEKEISGGEAATTNNRMELTAVIRALQALKMPATVTIHTDSRYVMDGATRWMTRWKLNGWRTADKKPVKNDDLWRTDSCASAVPASGKLLEMRPAFLPRADARVSGVRNAQTTEGAFAAGRSVWTAEAQRPLSLRWHAMPCCGFRSISTSRK